MFETNGFAPPRPEICRIGMQGGTMTSNIELAPACPDSPLGLAPSLASFARVIDLGSLLAPEEIERGLLEMETGLMLIASECIKADIQGCALRTAATDFEGFPHMATFHAGVEDVLTGELPKELIPWARTVLEASSGEAAERVRTELVARAISDPVPIRRALFRFLLFEAIRLNLVALAMIFPRDVFGSGLEREDLDRLAEEELQVWLDTPLDQLDGIRPFAVIVTAGLDMAADEAERLQFALRTATADFRARLEIRARVEAGFASMNAADGLVLRNEFAEELGAQYLEVDRLRARHPMAFGDVKRGALYQRRHEIVKRRRDGRSLIKKRRRLALLDLIAEPEKGPEGEE